MSDVESQEVNYDEDEENTLKILVATDNHLGYSEQHLIRGEDSFRAFEEVLQIAVREDVDFILLGGDLFHDAKPTPYTVFKCSQLIRQYCFGDKPVKIEFLSDQSFHFKHLINPIVNYEDPNLNIAYPIFSIHGNHDDPTGSKSISTLNLLSTNGLINYFGRYNNYSQVDVVPMLLKKGTTQLAIYGLSHIHDQRLARMFRDGNVTMVQPDGDDWFHLLVLHQNRAPRGANNYIPGSFLPKFMNLAIWGHEHDCRIDPELDSGVFISQPGSSVATSLSYGESIDKHIGLLRIKGKKFNMLPIPLKTVRPFVHKTVELTDPALVQDIDLDSAENMSAVAMKEVGNEIHRIVNMLAQERKDADLPPILPLIRVNVLYHEEGQQFNAIRLGQDFVDKVANIDNIILQKRKFVKGEGRGRFAPEESTVEDLETAEERAMCIHELVTAELDRRNYKDLMKVISITGINEAVSRFVEKRDRDAPRDLTKYQIKKTISAIKTMGLHSEESVNNAIIRLQEQRNSSNVAEMDEILNMFNGQQRQVNANEVNVDEDDSFDKYVGNAKPKAKAKPRAPRTGKTRGAKVNTDVNIIDDDDDMDITSPPPRPSRGRGSRGGRIKK